MIGRFDIAEKLASLRHPDEESHNKRPSHYGLVFHDDPYTTPEFVLKMIIDHLRMTLCDAHLAMLERKEDGHVLLGDFSREVAETKSMDIERAARERCFPLRIGVQRL